MAKQPPIRVALDLETTGLFAEQDAILEVAAVKFRGETILEKMETLVSPGRPIPFRVQRLTGITPQAIINAPTFDSIADQLHKFLGDYPIVGHSIPFDAGFLRRRGLARNNPLIDTFEMATVLLPSLPNYGLGYVAEALDIPVAPGRHRAMVDTLLAMDVFLALHRMLDAVDTPILKDLAHLHAPRVWPLLSYFRLVWRERVEQEGPQPMGFRGSLGDRFASQLGMDPRVLSFAIAHQPDTAATIPTSTALPEVMTVVPLERPVAVIPEAASPSLTVARQAGYQAASSAIGRALDMRSLLLLEVTIGAGDYSPALFPALEWLEKKQQPAPGSIPARLVIATATPLGARRLAEKTLPRMLAKLHSSLPVALLAERGGYLCLHRWFSPALRRSGEELTAEQARGVAKLTLWAQQTLTGERSELTLLPQEVAPWGRISSGMERVALADGHSKTPCDRCLYRKHGYCFPSRAEERAKEASIVVTTHAGLLDDLTSPRSLLKAIPHRLILDADLFEEEYARWNSKDLDHDRLLTLLHTIGAETPDGRFQGILALAAPALNEHGPGGLSTSLMLEKSALDARLLSWFQTLRQAHVAVDVLFKALGQLLQEGTNGGGARDNAKHETSARPHGGKGADRPDQPLRLSAQMRNLPGWREVDHAWQQLDQRLQAVMRVVNDAQKLLLTPLPGALRNIQGGSEEEGVAWELAALAQRLHQQKQLAHRAFSIGAETASNQEDEERVESVFWLRLPPPSQAPQARSSDSSSSTALAGAQQVENYPVLYGQDVQTAEFLKQYLLTPGTGAILAGVALSVDHSFAFYRGRYGLDTCPAFSVVTEYHEQTLLFMPNDVPEPNMPQYQRHLDEAIVNLATTLDGQLVVLFTSYAALRSSYAAVKPLLEGRSILVLGHGVDGSPRQLWQAFREQERVVLFGTGTFWDGIDEVSRAPACVLVARLPMPVLNDPPVAARAEQYSDQLHQLTVPVASQKVRRSLNRLAWSDPRRNAVVLFDRRVLSKEYGATVLHTLPRCSQRQDTVSRMPETILDWLTGTGSWDG